MIAPGMREPPTVVTEREAAAMVAYARRASRQPYPGFPAHIETVGAVWARYCVGCHKIDGDGGKDGPDLSHEGKKHDAATLRRWIVDPGTGRSECRHAVVRRPAQLRAARRGFGISRGAEVTDRIRRG